MVDHKFDDKTLQGIYDGMVEIEPEKTTQLAQKAFDGGTDVLKIVDALTKGINTVGDKFEAMERFLPELIIAAGIMDDCMELFAQSLRKRICQLVHREQS